MVRVSLTYFVFYVLYRGRAVGVYVFNGAMASGCILGIIAASLSEGHVAGMYGRRRSHATCLFYLVWLVSIRAVPLCSAGSSIGAPRGLSLSVFRLPTSDNRLSPVCSGKREGRGSETVLEFSGGPDLHGGGQ